MPRAADRPGSINLDELDRPAEALLCPLVNPLPRLLSDGLEKPVHVVTRTGDNVLDYTMGRDESGFSVMGTSQGQPFVLRGMPLHGDLPGGTVSLDVDYALEEDTHDFHTAGQVGSVPVTEHLHITPEDGGAYARLDGTLGDAAFQSAVIRDGNKLYWFGTLDGQPFLQTVERTAQGGVARGFLGGQRLEQSVEFTQ